MKITKQQYDFIKIANKSNCLAVAVEKVEKEFEVNNHMAHKMCMAVMHNYKYLKVI